MEFNEWSIALLISITLLGLLFAWIPCLDGCDRLVRWHVASRDKRRLEREGLKAAPLEEQHLESIA